MFGACKYRWIFGKEGEGVHSLRVFGVAVVDVALTVAGGALLTASTGELTRVRFATV